MKKVALLSMLLIFLVGTVCYASTDADNLMQQYQEQLQFLQDQNEQIVENIQKYSAEIERLERQGYRNSGAIQMLNKLISQEKNAQDVEQINSAIEDRVEQND
jgi:peptidoglycan hydrolase CwlO-like protein